MKNLLFKIAVLLTIFFVSCSSDDSANDSNNGENTMSKDCNTLPKEEMATGSFRGKSFTVKGGKYREQSFGNAKRYSCAIYIKEATGDCIFPDFEGLNEQILFTISSLEPQTIKVSSDIGTETKPTLNFNRIANTNDGPVTEVELSCGTIIISGVTNNQLKGKVFANGIESSTINGAFTLDLCETGF